MFGGRAKRSKSTPRLRDRSDSVDLREPKRTSHCPARDDGIMSIITDTEDYNSAKAGEGEVKAYDALYDENVQLQEQLAEAVQLLKYVKEEHRGSAVSATIKDLTKEKMELKSELREAGERGEEAYRRIAVLDCDNARLRVQVEGLVQVKARGAKLLERVQTLERRASLPTGEDKAQAACQEAQLRAEKEAAEAEIDRLQRERASLLEDNKHMEERLDRLGKSVGAERALQGKLADALGHVAQLQQDSQVKEGQEIERLQRRLGELAEKNTQLETSNGDLRRETEQMEEILLDKKQRLDTLNAEYKEQRIRHQAELSRQMESLETRLVAEFNTEKEGLQKEAEDGMAERLQEMEELHQNQMKQQVELCRQANKRLQCQKEELERCREQWQKAQAAADNERSELNLENESLKLKFKEMQEMTDAKVQSVTENVNKESARSKELEKANAAQQTVIANLTSEHQVIVARLEAAVSSREVAEAGRRDDERRLTECHRRQHEEAKRCEEHDATRIQGLQAEVEGLREERAARERERRQGVDEREALRRERNEKVDELRRATDQLERHAMQEEEWARERAALAAKHESEVKRSDEEKTTLIEGYITKNDEVQKLNVENAKYLQKIKEYKSEMEVMQEEEDAKARSSVCKNEHAEVKVELEKQEEQNKNLTQKIEQLSSERGDLQQLVLTLQQTVKDAAAGLSATQDERNKLQDSLEETNTLCLQLESRLTNKQEKEETLEECKRKIKVLEAKEAASMSEKENTIASMMKMEANHNEAVAELQKQVSDSTLQFSERIDQLSTLSNEKAMVTADLATLKDTVERQRQKILELETTIVILGGDLDEANAHVNKLLASDKIIEQRSPSLASTDDERLDVETDSMSSEKHSITSNLSTSKSEIKAQRIKIAQLESSIKLLSAERKTANAEVPNTDEKNKMTERLEIEKAEAAARASEMEGNLAALQMKADDLTFELEASTNEINVLKTKLAEAESKNVSALTADEILNHGVHKSKFAELKISQSTKTAPTAQVQNTMKDYGDNLQKLNAKLRDTDDTNAILKEAIQDIQVEKEDLELENKELASRLTDLSIQAKNMISTNESLTKAMRDQQIEYKDRISELEILMEEECDDDFLLSLRNKYMTALEKNAKLQKYIDALGNEENKYQDTNNNNQPEDIKEESMEVTSGQVTQNSGRTEETNTILGDTIEILRAKNGQLRNGQLSELRGMSKRPPEPRLCDTSALTAVSMPSPTRTENVDSLIPFEGALNEASSSTLSSSRPNGQSAQRFRDASDENETPMKILTDFKFKLADHKGQCSGSRTKHQSQDHPSAENHQVAVTKQPNVCSLDTFQSDSVNGTEESDCSTFTGCHNGNPTSSSYVAREADDCSDCPSTTRCKDYDDSSCNYEMESTIVSHEPAKQLEPESAATLLEMSSGGNFLRECSSRREGSNVSNYCEDPPPEKAGLTYNPEFIEVSGGEYLGQFNSHGQKEGNGRMKFDNGNEYEGQWKNDMRNGKGTMKYASGNVYTGLWESNKRHGHGSFYIQRKGDVYTGNWVEGLKEGPGVYEYADGELDISYYQDDKRVGEGVRWNASRKRASRLVDGQLVGEEGSMMVYDALKLTKRLGFVV